MAKLNEIMYKLAPGYYLQERSVRDYPFDAGGNIFGYPRRGGFKCAEEPAIPGIPWVIISVKPGSNVPMKKKY